MTREATSDGHLYSIRELYYDADDNVVMWSEAPDPVSGESPEDVYRDLQAMLKATDQGVFDLDAREWVR